MCVCVPAVCDDIKHGCVKILLAHFLPLQHDAHAFGLDSCHGVIVIAEEGHSDDGHAVVHGLVDAVQTAVTQECPRVFVS